MPSLTERGLLTEAILETSIIQRAVDILLEADISSSSSSSDESSSESEDDSKMVHDPLIELLISLHSRRYLNRRVDIPKTQENIRMLLGVWKHEHPEIFRSHVRMNPATFDLLVEAIKANPIFQNNSMTAPQTPVDIQLAVCLYRFGHFGNAASLQKIALWAGFGYGTIDLFTTRVIFAVCQDTFRRSAIRWPNEDEKEIAKSWVEEQSCEAWRDGWLMVDGTLVPLFARPALYGTSFYDRKSNYSLNVQLISTPNLRIIDYGVGLPGSQHDSTAWQRTRLPHEHATLLQTGEWIWADSAYPIQSWLCAPYKSPEKDTEENTQFNYYVSRVRIRSEHCVGYLKGRFPSLRGLRLQINKSADVRFATYWIIAAIALHNFAMEHEGTEDFELDEFFNAGQTLAQIDWDDERHEDYGISIEGGDRTEELRLGKRKREKIKRDLFNYI